jgi:hypothetical protein
MGVHLPFIRNFTTARALGLTIPASFFQATEVIRCDAILTPPQRHALCRLNSSNPYRWFADTPVHAHP